MNRFVTLSIACLTGVLLCLSSVHAQNGGTAVGFPQLGGIVILDNDDLDISLQEGFTIEMWVKPGNTNDNSGLRQELARRGLSNQDHSWQLYLEGGKLIFKSQGSSGVYAGEIETASILQTDRWYHIAAGVERGGNSDFSFIYVNGEFVGSGTFALGYVSGPSNDHALVMASSWFSGEIDDIRYWSKHLSAARINQWMHKEVNSLHPDYANMVFNFNCNEGSGMQLNGVQGSISQADLVANPDGVAPSWVNSEVPTVGADPEFQDYLSVSAIWSTKTSAQSGNLHFSAPNISAGNSIIFATTPDYALSREGIQNCSPGAYDARFSHSWRLVKQGGTINLDYLRFDLDPHIGENEYLRAGMMFGNIKDDFSTNTNCPETLQKDGDTYRPSFNFSSSQLQVDYIGVGFILPDPPIRACNDPNGGLQIIFDAALGCEGENSADLIGMSEIGFHSGGTADVTEIWGSPRNWEEEGAVRAYADGSSEFVAYIPDVDAYYGVNGVQRINLLFNQGPSNPGNPWAVTGKDTAEDGNCKDFWLFLEDVTETCAFTSVKTPKSPQPVSVAPNPFSESTTLSFPNPKGQAFSLSLLNPAGQVVRQVQGIQGSEVEILRGNLPAGLYVAVLRSATGQQLQTRLMIR